MLSLRFSLGLLIAELAYVVLWLGHDTGRPGIGLLLIFWAESGFLLKAANYNLVVKKEIGRIPAALRIRTAAPALGILLIMGLGANGITERRYWWVWTLVFFVSAAAKVIYVRAARGSVAADAGSAAQFWN
jgi:hypothetical protein